MKKIGSLFLLLLTLVATALTLASCGKSAGGADFIETEYAGSTLYVYNWGEYISDGSDGSLDVIALFEDTYGIDVKYDYFSTNEEMYAQISSGASYDIVIPSDYMIERMVNEGLLYELDFSNIPNYHYIADQYRGQYFDPSDKYSVPYAVGMLGIVYNKTMVDEVTDDPATRTWDLLWNESYTAGQKINMNNPRDALGVSMLSLGIDVNTTDEAEWRRAYDKLSRLDCIYLMDEIYNKMENNTSAMAAYYAGDCLSMMQANPDLDFFYPTEGTNIFIDSMCIPSTARSKGAAELFINFMLDPDVATANANYICYASPHTGVLTHEDYDYGVGTEYYSYLYELPESYRNDPTKTQYYRILDDDTQAILNNLWARLGIEDPDGDSGRVGTYIFLGSVAAVFLACFGWLIYKNVRERKLARKYRPTRGK